VSGCGVLGRDFSFQGLKSRKKVVRKYLNLKGWMRRHLLNPLILQVFTYQILDNKGLAGGHVIVVVNIGRFNTWSHRPASDGGTGEATQKNVPRGTFSWTTEGPPTWQAGGWEWDFLPSRIPRKAGVVSS